MAIFRGTKIRGSQIQDRTVDGKQIIQEAIVNEHISPDAAIHEDKLDINWNAHTEVLVDRKVVDYVEANKLKVKGTQINLQSQINEIDGVKTATSDNSVEGIIVEGDKNKAPMRNSFTGEPLVATIDDVDYEVIARVEYYVDEEDEDDTGSYFLRFYTASGEDGDEVPYSLGSDEITVDILYARRWNLKDVDEMFAANEKFVHGAADVTAYLNIQQLAKDIYGDDWKVNRDGEAHLEESLIDQIKAEVDRSIIAETQLQLNIDDEKNLRITADTDLQNQIDRLDANDKTTDSVLYKIRTKVTDPLKSTDIDKGATLVGIYEINGMDGIVDVQGALEFLKENAGDALVDFKDALASTEIGEGASLIGVDALSGLNGSTVQAVLVDHEERLDILEGNDQRVGSVDYKINTQVLKPLASDETGDGAAMVAVESGSGLNGTTVQAVLEDHEDRLDVAEATLDGALVRNASSNDYFTSDEFDTLNERLTDSENITDENLKRIDDRNLVDRTRVATTHKFFEAGQKATLKDRFADIETIVDSKSKEIEDARGDKPSLNARLNVVLRSDGHLKDDAKIHEHRKYTHQITENQTEIILPGEHAFNISTSTGSGSIAIDTVQVYVNGILQANGINFTEIISDEDATKGKGVDFAPEELLPGDIVVLEWVVNNAN